MKNNRFLKATGILMLSLLLAAMVGCAKEDPVVPDSSAAPDNAPASASEPDDNTEKPADSPAVATGQLIEDAYISVHEDENWIFYSRSGTLTLKYGDPESDVSMEISYATLVTVQEKLDQALEEDGAVQGENVTFGGIEYYMVECADEGEIILVTTEARPVVDTEWDETMDLVLSIELSEATLEQAAPVLESLKVNTEIMEIQHEWPENDPVETEHFTYTATGGWYLYDKFDNPYSNYTLGNMQNDDFFPPAYLEISWSMGDPEDVAEIIDYAYTGCVARGEVTIAGITYTVYADEPDSDDTVAANTFLVAPIESGGTIEIRIQSVGAEGAMPVLETIKIK